MIQLEIKESTRTSTAAITIRVEMVITSDKLEEVVKNILETYDKNYKLYDVT